LIKWTKRWWAAYIKEILEQYAQVFEAIGYGVLEAARIPQRTRTNFRARKNVHTIRVGRNVMYIAPKDMIDKLLENEKRRLEKERLKASYQQYLAGGCQVPEAECIQIDAKEKTKPVIRRLKRCRK
jgi:hypothetical protein